MGQVYTNVTIYNCEERAVRDWPYRVPVKGGWASMTASLLSGIVELPHTLQTGSLTILS